MGEKTLKLKQLVKNSTTLETQLHNIQNDKVFKTSWRMILKEIKEWGHEKDGKWIEEEQILSDISVVC